VVGRHLKLPRALRVPHEHQPALHLSSVHRPRIAFLRRARNVQPSLLTKCPKLTASQFFKPPCTPSPDFDAGPIFDTLSNGKVSAVTAPPLCRAALLVVMIRGVMHGRWTKCIWSMGGVSDQMHLVAKSPAPGAPRSPRATRRHMARTAAGDAAVAARTARLKARFLEAYAEIGAAKKAAICTSMPWQWKAADPAFAAAWEEIRHHQTEDVEASLYQLAIGIDVPVHHEGVVIGTRKLVSDRAAILLLRARRPEVYGDGGPRVRGAAVAGYQRNGERGEIVSRTTIRVAADADEAARAAAEIRAQRTLAIEDHSDSDACAQMHLVAQPDDVRSTGPHMPASDTPSTGRRMPAPIVKRRHQREKVGRVRVFPSIGSRW
jgi:hypothetical protein